MQVSLNIQSITNGFLSLQGTTKMAKNSPNFVASKPVITIIFKTIGCNFYIFFYFMKYKKMYTI